MRKPAAAAKAKASSEPSKRPRVAARAASSEPPVAKRMYGKQAAGAVSASEADMERILSKDPIHKQLQEALVRAAAAEAREEAAREQARCARQECRDATTLAQQRSERAASAEGQLKMLREVYDQMHDAYAGSMTIIKSVAAALPRNCLPDGEGVPDELSQLMLEAPSLNAVDSTMPPKTPRARSLSPSPLRAPVPITAGDQSVATALLSNVRNSVPFAAISLNASSGKERSERVGFEQTPSRSPITPMREPKQTPEKSDKYSDPPPRTPNNLARTLSQEQLLLNDASANPSAEVDVCAVEKTDPKKVLSTIPWPSTINQWGSLQSKVWAGHQAIPKEWLRIWSKSHDAEYYLNLINRKTTFDIKEVK